MPCVLTTAEHKFVMGFAGENGPKIIIVDRDTLDSWLSDDLEVDSYFQRDLTTTLLEPPVCWDRNAPCCSAAL